MTSSIAAEPAPETPQVGTVNLLDVLTEGRRLPRGCDSWAIRSVHPDGRSKHDFRWPFKGKVEAPGPFIASNTDGCPSQIGDGICLAHSWRGMASGSIPAVTLLLVAYSSANVLGRTDDEQKVRVSCAVVVEVVDGQRLLREQGSGADLSGANLSGANLSGANLYGANLYGASLSRADLSGADLSGADLSGANLSGANLSGADLYGADLYGADLSGADLSGADLSGANLSGANLYGANLYGADLSGANLSGADLSRASLSGANLYGASLSRADLSGANLSGASLSRAKVYTTTTMPTGFDAIAAGCVVSK